MNDRILPGVSDRAKAVMVDTVILIIIMAIFTYALDFLKIDSANIKMIGFVFIFILYDPLLTSLTGGTIGHHSFGLKVKRLRQQQQNISFPFALLRFVLKSALGWISLLIVQSDKNHQAIHDKVVSSIVLFKKQS